VTAHQGLAATDLAAELAAARTELRRYREHCDEVTADLMLAWIDALLDEWNRRAKA
jgi:hypothetical protein